MKNKYLILSDEVADALNEGRPIVALESTIISHGMPFPENVESALTSERIVREAGAVPATIAVLGGKIRIGLSDRELEYLGRDSTIPKASRRDMAMLIAGRMDGATTVATTMLCASLAGIGIFATGGIGGVHRRGQDTFDISADLQELAHTDTAVVCAGVKSILDIGLTLEYLETHGVPVVGYRTAEFPAFYTRSSGFCVDYRLDTPEAVANALKVKRELGLRGGMVIANPIPTEFELENGYIQDIICSSVEEARLKEIRGKHVTPYILARLHEATGSRSLAANKQLVYSNVRLAAEIACAYAAAAS